MAAVLEAWTLDATTSMSKTGVVAALRLWTLHPIALAVVELAVREQMSLTCSPAVVVLEGEGLRCLRFC